MSSAGNAGGLRHNTMVGLKALTTATPATPQPALKKAQGAKGKIVDRVERDDDSEKNRRRYMAEHEEEASEAGLELPAGHSSGLRWFDGEAFRRDAKGREIPPSYGDVDQGNLADAWLLATCAAVAHAAPATLLRRVRRRSARDFIVELADEAVVVKPEFPVEGYADPLPLGQKDTLWVALVEKAFAHWEAGAYANLETGNAARALELLTGKPSRRISLADHLPFERAFSRLREARRGGAPIVLKTRGINGLTEPLVPEHHYAVLDVLELEGEKQLRVYNPWGSGGGTRAVETMVHTLSATTLSRDFEAAFVGG